MVEYQHSQLPIIIAIFTRGYSLTSIDFLNEWWDCTLFMHMAIFIKPVPITLVKCQLHYANIVWPFSFWFHIFVLESLVNILWISLLSQTLLIPSIKRRDCTLWIHIISLNDTASTMPAKCQLHYHHFPFDFLFFSLPLLSAITLLFLFPTKF